MDKDILVCEANIVHLDVVNRIAEKMIDGGSLQKLGMFFKTLGDPTRLKILFALSESEMCVCDISALLDMTQSAISHQLRVLKNVGLVKYEKRGKSVYYSLDDDHVKGVFDLGLEHILHQE